MELKQFPAKEQKALGVLLIVPYGIETHNRYY